MEDAPKLDPEIALQLLVETIETIAHDIAGPLTTMRMGAGMVDVLLQKDGDKAKIQQLTGGIRGGAETLNHLRLLLLEKTRVLTGGPVHLDLQPVSPAEIIAAATQLQNPRVRGNRVVRVETEDISLLADKAKLTLVLHELIENALKFSDGNPQVLWNQEPLGETVITVQDAGVNGRGLSRRAADALLKPPSRLTAARQGLGLVSVGEIVAAHGGRLLIKCEPEIRSTDGFKTAVVVCIPGVGRPTPGVQCA